MSLHFDAEFQCFFLCLSTVFLYLFYLYMYIDCSLNFSYYNSAFFHQNWTLILFSFFMQCFKFLVFCKLGSNLSFLTDLSKLMVKFIAGLLCRTFWHIMKVNLFQFCFQCYSRIVFFRTGTQFQKILSFSLCNSCNIN